VPGLAAVDEKTENKNASAQLIGLKSARGRGLALDELLETNSAHREVGDRVGPNHPGLDLVRNICGTVSGKPHTMNHINCPACQAFDELMKADLLGMANQTFPEAAKVWQRVRRNSTALRNRTHEGVEEYIVALTRFFKDIVMRSVNPGMLKAYQVARKSKYWRGTIPSHAAKSRPLWKAAPLPMSKAADQLISRLLFTDPLHFIWMYNRLLGQVIAAN